MPSASPASAHPALRERTVSPAFVASCLQPPAWAREAGSAPDGDVVLSSRARLARNLAAYPFPPNAGDDALRRVAQEVRRAALADTERLGDLIAVEIAALSGRERRELLNARRISPELAHALPHRYALLDDAARVSLFVNEEDHLRIQAMEAGNAPLLALNSAEDADRRLARRLTFAHDARWGYLTSALTNVGTGLRISSLLHLPALSFLGRLADALSAADRLGISIRGVHGEHSRAFGDLYQVSNAVTWGLTASQIAGRVRPVVDYLVASERHARQEVGVHFADTVLQRAHAAAQRIEQSEQLAASDALNLLSALRLAATLPLAEIDVPSSLPLPGTVSFARLVADLYERPTLGEAGGSDDADGSGIRDAISRTARLRLSLRSLV